MNTKILPIFITVATVAFIANILELIFVSTSAIQRKKSLSTVSDYSTQMMISLLYSFQHKTTLGQNTSKYKNHSKMMQGIPMAHFRKCFSRPSHTSCRQLEPATRLFSSPSLIFPYSKPFSTSKILTYMKNRGRKTLSRGKLTKAA